MKQARQYAASSQMRSLTHCLSDACVLAVSVSLVFVAAPVMAGDGLGEEPWLVHEGYEDFIQGTFGDGGANTFVARNGGVQMIHRWDLNNDGYLDLAVGQSHNTFEQPDALIYWGSHKGPRSLMPPLPQHQPLAKLLDEIKSREKGVTLLPAAGGGRGLIEDLNGDGYPEVVFCNYMHNSQIESDAYIYWGHRDGYDETRRTSLLTLRALAVTSGDFNGDGFVDLAFANNGSELASRFGHHKHEESFIYWNGPLGFSEDRRMSIPTLSATDCAAGDLDGDGRPELIFVNQHPGNESIHIFRISEDGLTADRLDVIQRGSPRAVELADVNLDGRLDLIIMHADSIAEVLAGTADGFNETPMAALEISNAVECRAADLNRDGFVDLVFPNKESDGKTGSYIYWGGLEGLSNQQRTELPTLHSLDASIADFNQDGWADIAFANESSRLTTDVNSYIYWNDRGQFHAAYRSEVQGFGPVSTAAADLNQDGHQDLLLVNRTSGATWMNEASPGSLIYWGNTSHQYSAASVTHLPTTSDAMALADYNQDGHVDIAYPNGDLYWGGPDGMDPARRSKLDITPGNGVTTADLNRDGYLDLVIPGGSGYGEESVAKGMIYWGDGETFTKQNMTELDLNVYIPQTAAIADLNKDGFLDLVFPDVDSKTVDFFWGNERGDYSPEHRTTLEVQNASTVEIADLNGDGWLDLIFGGTYDRENYGQHSRYGKLLWGSAEGYSPDHSVTLEAYDSDEQSVADLNKDGYLDIITTNYHGYTTRSIPFFIYWGGADGSYTEQRRTSLPAESSLRVSVADFNQDDWLDIVVFNHQERGDHTSGANIYWGGEEGYSPARSDWIPSFGVHFGDRHDLGNIYTRRLEEEYVSTALMIPDGKYPSRLHWKADTPHGTSIRFQIRTSPTSEDLAQESWTGPEGEGTYYLISDVAIQTQTTDDHWLQYRAVLVTPDGGSTPVLTRVRIDVFTNQSSSN